MRSRLVTGVLGVTLLAVGAQPASSDPCGMVPPMTMIEGDPIVRVGAQKTYAFYYKGVETIVLRPGFEGKVDEFGMLIPFPSAPEIRKVDDNIFPHIAAAVDPPEVFAYVRRRWRGRMSGGAGMKSKSVSSSAADEPGLGYDEVRVVRQEAVGMYDVAVLEAGSASALKKWMDSHGFRYPEGMDEVTNEYVADGWMFVAVKTRVGQKKGVNPRPGMRTADSKLPEGATFSGHVQAMGFRFKSDEFVIPMRLSAFNKGKLRNIVYILSDTPKRIDNIPKRFVVRQLSGKEIYRNVTGPLPLRVIGGTYKDLTAGQKQALVSQRKPEPHNGLAKHLFASDLLAVKKRRLSNPFEEEEKELLSIGERLGLRGREIDDLHAHVLDKKRERAVTKALAGIKSMTFTIVDGEFDRDVLARENLKLARYKVPGKRNTRIHYDARQQGPGQQRGGKLYRGKGASLEQTPSGPSWFRWGAGGLGFGALLLFAGFVAVRRSGRRGARLTGLVVLLGVALGAAVPAWSAGKPTIPQLIAQLSDGDRAQEAVDELAKRGDAAVDPLLDEIVDSDDMTVKGWAIVALSQIGGDAVDKELQKIHDGNSYHMLVRTWAAAARVELAPDTKAVVALAPLAQRFPAVGRPIGLRLTAQLASQKGWRGAEAALDAVSKVPSAAQPLNKAIVAMGSKPLVGAMLQSADQNVRRLAAAYLPSVKGDVAGDVIAAVKFHKRAKQVPWDGGPLYIPGVQWSQDDARKLVGHLVRWHLWAELHGHADLQKQIHNNLINAQLARAAGYTSPGWQPVDAGRWLQVWGKVVGRREIGKILGQQGVRSKRKWRMVLMRID